MSPIKAESALTEMFGTRGFKIFASAQGGMLGMGPDSKDKIHVYACLPFTYNPSRVFTNSVYEAKLQAAEFCTWDGMVGLKWFWILEHLEFQKARLRMFSWYLRSV